MRYSKISFLLGILAVGAVAAQAQNAVSDSSNQSYTTVDAAGNLVRRTAERPAISRSGATVGTGNTVTSDRRRRDGDRDDKIRTGTTYYVPGVPYYPYPYPYGAPVYNHNHYYPAQPSTTILGTPKFSWQTPATITSIPLGTYYGGHPAYPAPVYPAPGYGYPAPVYGYPHYPGVPYPAYGSTTTIYGNGTGGVHTQSQTGGYGFSFGNGGFSVQLGNQRSSTTTTVTRY